MHVGVSEDVDADGDYVYKPDSLPDDYYDRRGAEYDTQQHDPFFVDPELEKMRTLFWHRRLFGLWVMIGPKGKQVPTYLTGLHYFYTSWWTIDIGKPKYRDNDREYSYFVGSSVEDPRCRGVMKITKRRGGKTFYLGCFIYERISRMKKARGGVQSKTEKDAQDTVYQKAIREPYEELPDFFQPEKVNSRLLGKRMEFSEYDAGSKYVARKFKRKSSGLQSVIDARSARELAYDGTKLHAYGSDEASKCEDADIYDRHMVVRFCLEEEENIIGFAMYTTTVEDMGGRNESFRKLWLQSDQNKRNKNDATKSGMYRYFEPASRVMFYDKYGMPDEEKAIIKILNDAESFKEDRKAYISYMKKNPLKEEHAFLIDDGQSPFDQLKLNEQLDLLEWEDDGVYSKMYQLEWTNGPFSDVKYREDPHGHFLIHELPPEDLMNNVQVTAQGMKPMNKDWYTSGLDMYKFKEVLEGKGSDAGLCVKKRLWTATPSTSNKPVALYLHRPATKERCYDDIMKLLWLYGVDVLAERNAGNFAEWMEDNSLEEFMIYIEGQPGIYAIEKSNAKLVEYLEEHIFNNAHNIFLKPLLTQGLDFDPANTQKYDAIMCWGYAEMADRMRASLRRKTVNKNNVSVTASLMSMIAKHPVSR